MLSTLRSTHLGVFRLCFSLLMLLMFPFVPPKSHCQRKLLLFDPDLGGRNAGTLHRVFFNFISTIYFVKLEYERSCDYLLIWLGSSNTK